MSRKDSNRLTRWLRQIRFRLGIGALYGPVYYRRAGRLRWLSIAWDPRDCFVGLRWDRRHYDTRTYYVVAIPTVIIQLEISIGWWKREGSAT